MIYRNINRSNRFRLCLGSALLFLCVAVIVLAILVWYFSEWGLGQVGKSPAWDDGKPLEIWHFLGGIFLACMIAPLFGLAYDPLLRHLTLEHRIPLSPPVAVVIALPFWYAAFVPTFVMLVDIVDTPTRVLLLLAPLACSVLTGALHLMMVEFAVRNMRHPKEERPAS